MTSQEEKNIVIGIKNSLKKDTKFMYYDGIEFKAGKDVLDVMPESIEFKVVIGTYFQVSDFFIIREVHHLGLTNPHTLFKCLAIKKKNHPEQSYPSYTYNELVKRLRFLVRQGLLFNYEYLDSYGRKIFVFFCRMYGWRVYKNKLQVPDTYDKDIVFMAETEVFKLMASSAVAYSFALSPLCLNVRIKEIAPLDEKKKIFLYAYAILGDETEKTEYIVEPIYFNIDKKIMSDAENETNILNRLDQLEKYISNRSNEVDVKLILCVENYDGLKRLVSLLITKDIEFYINNCYFTSENVIFESKDELSRSFLKLSLLNGKYIFSLAKDKWF